MKVLLHALICLACFSAARAGHPFLPVSEEPVRFTGTHWNDAWESDEFVAVELSIDAVAKSEQGELVKLVITRLGEGGQPRDFPELTFLLTPGGEIYRVNAEDGAGVEDLTPLDLVLPTLDESSRFTGLPEFPAEVEAAEGEYGLRWTSLPWTTEVSIDDGNLVRYRSFHPSGHFTRLAWQRGIGLTEIAIGSGARQDGWTLHRSLKVPGGFDDIESALSNLPSEFIPAGQHFSDLKNPDLRREIDDNKEWLSLTSNTDGEGETLEARLWKTEEGGRMLVMLLHQWSSGPTHTKALRVAGMDGGEVHHITTTLPLPGDSDFYAQEDAVSRPPGRLIEGRWSLPRQGDIIVIRPPNEEAADLMPESVTSEESYFFELIWDGVEFQSITLPRIIPPAPFEPSEWIFQQSGSQTGLLYLKRTTDQLEGEWVRPGENIPVTGEIHAEGPEILFSVKGEEFSATLTGDENPIQVWESLSLVIESPDGEEIHFRAVPQDPDAAELPRCRLEEEEGIAVPQFEADTPDWKAINERIASLIKTGRDDFAAAPKTTTADDPASLSMVFEIVSHRPTTLSLRFTTTRYLGGPHGQVWHEALNYDFKSHRFLALEDVLKLDGENSGTVADLLNQSLVESGELEEGQSLVSPEVMGEIPWTLQLPFNLEFSIAPDSLSPQNVETLMVLPYQTLHEAGLIREGGALDPHRE